MFSHFAGTPVYNTRAIVQRTGVPADTFRAWERRYGLPKPARTAGNQRLYSEKDAALIGWLRDQTRQGLTISQAVALYHAGEPAASERTSPPATVNDVAAPHVSGQSGHFARCRDLMLAALTDFDTAGADRALDEAIAVGTVEQVCLHVLQPVMVEFGERWERGDASISVEHFATAFVLRKFGALFNVSAPENGRGPILAGCVEGELHEVGLLLTCLLLSRRGYRVVYLGPNLPVPDLIQAIRAVRPMVILLSTSTSPGAEMLIDAIDQIESDLARRPTPFAAAPIVGYGGQIFQQHPDLQSRAHGVYLGADVEHAVQKIDRLMSETVGIGVR